MKKKNQKIQKKSKKPKKPEKKVQGRSHHVQVKCRIPGCGVKVRDIRRHLVTHVKREELHADDVNAYAEIMRHGKQKTLFSTGNPEKRGKTPPVRRRKTWCPMPHCDTICVCMDKHLQTDHHLKVGTVPYKIHLKEAKLYRGITELDDLSPIVPEEPQPSTSSAGPQQQTTRMIRPVMGRLTSVPHQPQSLTLRLTLSQRHQTQGTVIPRT